MKQAKPTAPARRAPTVVRWLALVIALGFVAVTVPGHDRRALDVDELLAIELSSRSIAEQLAQPFTPGPRSSLESLVLGTWLDGSHSPRDARLLSCLMLLCTVALTFRLGRRLFGTASAVAACLLLVALPASFAVTHRVELSGFMAVLTMAALVLLEEALGGRRRWLAALAVVLLLLWICHPLGPLAVLAWCATAAIVTTPRRRAHGGEQLRLAGSVAAGIVPAFAYLTFAKNHSVDPMGRAWMPRQSWGEVLLGSSRLEAIVEPVVPTAVVVIAMLAVAGLSARGSANRWGSALALGVGALPLGGAMLLTDTTRATVTPELAALAMPTLALLAGRALATPLRLRRLRSDVQIATALLLAFVIASPLATAQLTRRWTKPGPPIDEAARMLARLVAPEDTVLFSGWAGLLLPAAIDSHASAPRARAGQQWARFPALSPGEDATCQLYLDHTHRSATGSGALKHDALAYDRLPMLCPDVLGTGVSPIGDRRALEAMLGAPGSKWIVWIEGTGLPTPTASAWTRTRRWLSELPGARYSIRRAHHVVLIRHIEERLLLGELTLTGAEAARDEGGWSVESISPMRLVARLDSSSSARYGAQRGALVVDRSRTAPGFSDPQGGGWSLVANGPTRLWTLDSANGLVLTPELAVGEDTAIAFLPRTRTHFSRYLPQARELRLEIGLRGVPFPTTLEFENVSQRDRRIISIPAGATSWKQAPGETMYLPAGTHHFSLGLGTDSVERYDSAGRSAPVVSLRFSAPAW